ncbi:MAG: sugar kinase [Rhizobiaceae bacterium]
MSTGIASVGECMLELSGAGEGQWRMGFAGDTFNTLWALKALSGRDCDYVSAFGDDPFSKDQIAFLDHHGIGIAASPIIAGARPGLYAISLTGAERSFTYWRSDSAARRLADDAAALGRSLGGRALVYFSGITLAILDQPGRDALIAAIRDARAGGSLIAFDPNYRPRLWTDADGARAAFSAAYGVTDVALPTFPDEQTLFGDPTPHATADRLLESGIGEVIVKDGENPALVAVGANRETVRAISVSAVDTTGAGDSFNGAYLAARLSGDQPIEAAHRAHRVAAAVVQVRGALAVVEVLQTAFAQG